jgi:hypothetical protein
MFYTCLLGSCRRYSWMPLCVERVVLVNICGQKFPRREERFRAPLARDYFTIHNAEWQLLSSVFVLPSIASILQCSRKFSFSALFNIVWCSWFGLGCFYCKIIFSWAIPGRVTALYWTKAWLLLARNSACGGNAAKSHKEIKRGPAPGTYTNLTTLATTASCPGLKAKQLNPRLSSPLAIASLHKTLPEHFARRLRTCSPNYPPASAQKLLSFILSLHQRTTMSISCSKSRIPRHPRLLDADRP